MKRKEFEDKIEGAAKNFEDKIEAAADRFDKAVNSAAETKVGRRIVRLINIIVVLALIIGGIVLICNAHTVWAIVCFAFAGASVIWQIIEYFLFED